MPSEAEVVASSRPQYGPACGTIHRLIGGGDATSDMPDLICVIRFGNPQPPPAAKCEKPTDGTEEVDWSDAKVTPLYKPARPNLDKVRELCNWCVAMHISTTHTHVLAREVLAQLEGA